MFTINLLFTRRAILKTVTYIFTSIFFFANRSHSVAVASDEATTNAYGVGNYGQGDYPGQTQKVHLPIIVKKD